MTPEYTEFLLAKRPRPVPVGAEPYPIRSPMFDFQKHCTEFAIRQGRAALFLDTGLGKTLCELEFALQGAEFTNGKSLILTPLAVAWQIAREADRFGYAAQVVRDRSEVRGGINICNYDRLDRLDPTVFGAVILDESSILKGAMGVRPKQLIEAFANARFKLCATATPAPNDHAELGMHCEFLGLMKRPDMLTRWFINDSSRTNTWRLKGHAWRAFWDWCASWARMAETPADLGYDASRFCLPPLRIVRHHAAGDIRAPAGELFTQNVSATSLHDIKRQTAEARAEAVAKLVEQEPTTWVIWLDTDYEADALRARLGQGVEVRGSHSPEIKERRLAAFANGDEKIIITKPSIAGLGLNWQHCSRMAYVGRSFSYEDWYQSVRRCWRYGQANPVEVHLIVAEGEDQIGRVIDRKAQDHAAMKRAMADAMRRDRAAAAEYRRIYEPKHDGELPPWLCAA